MLVEKLLLHLLIIFAPILVYSFLYENKKSPHHPYIYGVFQGISATLCMAFPTVNYGLAWDLRYVPLVLSFLYGGPLAGGIVFLFIILTRTIIGGDALMFGYVSAILAVIAPILFYKKFWKVSPSKRIWLSVSIGFWPGLVQLGILAAYLLFTGPITDYLQLFEFIAIFGVIHLTGIGVAAKLNEMMVERHLLKKEIQRTEKMNSIGELAASIAHEVRNPLTVVKGFIQLIHQKEKSGENHDYLTLVLSELGRAEAIINDYLNFAKPQFEKIEQFPLGDTIIEVSQLLEPLAAKQGIQLHRVMDSQAQLVTDRNQFKQALINVIKNSIEATEAGGKVSVHFFDRDSMAYIVVRDTGKGMSKEQLSRIGTLFYTTKDKGTGLGTMVSMRIIESMNGKIVYNSSPGNGTEVTITIPILLGD